VFSERSKHLTPTRGTLHAVHTSHYHLHTVSATQLYPLPTTTQLRPTQHTSAVLRPKAASCSTHPRLRREADCGPGVTTVGRRTRERGERAHITRVHERSKHRRLERVHITFRTAPVPCSCQLRSGVCRLVGVAGQRGTGGVHGHITAGGGGARTRGGPRSKAGWLAVGTPLRGGGGGGEGGE
jgi:hypothetical protein